MEGLEKVKANEDIKEKEDWELESILEGLKSIQATLQLRPAQEAVSARIKEIETEIKKRKNKPKL